MDEFLTFRQWLKKKFVVDDATREAVKFMAFYVGGLILCTGLIFLLPITIFGKFGFIIAVPGMAVFILYWIYRLDRFFGFDQEDD
ncbi:MAG: hypothetical protein ACXADO_00790 [Candidatus Thorarchaeota archaeon]|jgi:hypothetical protein